MNNNNYKLSNQPNSYLFTELGGIWLEVSAVMARQIFAISNVELLIFDGESESVIASQKQLEEAIANNEMLVIFLGDVDH